jgi:hypothetical protein
LADFELGLNHSKTRIDLLPTRLDEDWKREIRLLELEPLGGDAASRFVSFFDGVIHLAAKHPTKGVIGFALSRMRSMDVSPQTWDLFQDVLLQLSAAEPSALPVALSKLAHGHKVGDEVDRTRMTTFVNVQAVKHANLGHANEVAWLMWAALVFELKLSKAVSRAISRMSDSIVALVALHAQNNSLFDAPLTTARWASLLSTDALYGRNWLQVYECGMKAWLKPSNPSYLGGDASFGWLRDVGVEFYDELGAEPVGPSGVQDMSWLDELDAAAELRARHYGDRESHDSKRSGEVEVGDFDIDSDIRF